MAACGSGPDNAVSEPTQVGVFAGIAPRDQEDRAVSSAELRGKALRTLATHNTATPSEANLANLAAYVQQIASRPSALVPAVSAWYDRHSRP
jgi:hypothetical protein